MMVPLASITPSGSPWGAVMTRATVPLTLSFTRPTPRSAGGIGIAPIGGGWSTICCDVRSFVICCAVTSPARLGTPAIRTRSPW